MPFLFPGIKMLTVSSGSCEVRVGGYSPGFSEKRLHDPLLLVTKCYLDILMPVFFFQRALVLWLAVASLARPLGLALYPRVANYKRLGSH